MHYTPGWAANCCSPYASLLWLSLASEESPPEVYASLCGLPSREQGEFDFTAHGQATCLCTCNPEVCASHNLRPTAWSQVNQRWPSSWSKWQEMERRRLTPWKEVSLMNFCFCFFEFLLRTQETLIQFTLLNSLVDSFFYSDERFIFPAINKFSIQLFSPVSWEAISNTKSVPTWLLKLLGIILIWI